MRQPQLLWQPSRLLPMGAHNFCRLPRCTSPARKEHSRSSAPAPTNTNYPRAPLQTLLLFVTSLIKLIYQFPYSQSRSLINGLITLIHLPSRTGNHPHSVNSAANLGVLIAPCLSKLQTLFALSPPSSRHHITTTHLLRKHNQ